MSVASINWWCCCVCFKNDPFSHRTSTICSKCKEKKKIELYFPFVFPFLSLCLINLIFAQRISLIPYTILLLWYFYWNRNECKTIFFIFLFSIFLWYHHFSHSLESNKMVTWIKAKFFLHLYLFILFSSLFWLAFYFFIA